MKEVTFVELIEENKKVELFGEDPYYNPNYIVDVDDVLKLMQQVREATIAEIESKANEYGEFGTADYVHEMPTDRIKLTENK